MWMILSSLIFSSVAHSEAGNTIFPEATRFNWFFFLDI